MFADSTVGELLERMASGHSRYPVLRLRQSDTIDDGRLDALPVIDTARTVGRYQTIGGLVVETMQRLPEPGDTITLDLPAGAGDDEGQAPRRLEITVSAVRRRVPASVRLAWADDEETRECCRDPCLDRSGRPERSSLP